MQNNNQIIKYKLNFLNKIKQKIISIFTKKQEVKTYTYNYDIIKGDKTSKEKIMEIYKQIKNDKIGNRVVVTVKSVNDLDESVVSKLIILMNEEMKINIEKINKEIESMKTHLYNMEMYNKQIELLKKNS